MSCRQKECEAKDGIKKIWVLNSSDCIFNGFQFVRMKRKYGRFKREIQEIQPKPTKATGTAYEHIITLKA